MKRIESEEGIEMSLEIILKFLENSSDILLFCSDQFFPSAVIEIDIFKKAISG